MSKKAILKCAVLVLIFACFTSGFLNAQIQQMITNIKVKPEYNLSPDMSASNVSKQGVFNKWIQIDIDFTTALRNSPLGKEYFEWLDNVRVEVDILLPTGNPKKQFVLLMGRADYWSFAMDGKEHHIVMFVPPDILKRWAPAQKFSSPEVRKLEIRVTFKMNDAVIAVGYNVPRGRTEAEVARRFQTVGMLPDLDRVRNGVYSKDKTPWAHIDFDYYELLKTDNSRD